MDSLEGISSRIPWKCSAPGDDPVKAQNRDKLGLNQTYSRNLNILETNFNRSAVNHGQSDIMVHLNFSFDLDSDQVFWKRLLFSWSKLRCLHPLLAATISAIPVSTQSPSQNDTDTPPSVPQYEFHYTIPQNEEEAISQSRDTILVEEVSGFQDVQTTMNKWIKENVLNGKRVYLDQQSCLARLLLVKNISGQSALTLVISHVISDGVSVITILNDLFKMISSPDLPTPLALPTYLSHSEFMLGIQTVNAPIEIDLSILPLWNLLPTSTTCLQLPLASEELYPVLPLGTTDNDTSSSLIKRRWIWAISRVLSNLQHRNYPQSVQLPRNNGSPSLPITSWPILKFSKEDSTWLIRLSKRHSLSPSMLLYSIIGMAISDQFSTLDPDSSVVIGFPFSLRPFLALSQPAVDLAIRITFSAIHFPATPSTSDVKLLEQNVITHARLAKKQLARRLRKDSIARTQLLASSYLSNLNRMRTSQGKDSWYSEPKSALNASMIGDLDRILPTVFHLPSSDGELPGVLTLSNLLIGTRLHTGEGTLCEVWTFEGKISISIGYDSNIFNAMQISAILSSINKIGQNLVNIERNRQNL